MLNEDHIIALATASGMGAIAVIRISGPDSITLVSNNFKPSNNKPLTTQKGNTIHLGHLIDNDIVIDQVLVSLFKEPYSYTGENVVEISCHGSPYIKQQIIQLFLRNGCRMATAGEFTLRAFLNGKMDLSQAEAVADLIASDNQASHQIAMQQMRGGFSNEIKELRTQLMNFASLIELELDFSQEDVEFADRTQFNQLLHKIVKALEKLIDSFALGNVIKNGIPVAIIGQPNVGKSTLLNALLNEERAIVSEIAGTTRDTIEDEISISGINFRFIDTAGIRETKDTIERIGIERSFEKIKQATLVLFLVDIKKDTQSDIDTIRNKYPDKKIQIIANKIDNATKTHIERFQRKNADALLISAKNTIGIDLLKKKLLHWANVGELVENNTIITNSRHYDSLLKALEAIQNIKLGMDSKLSGDLLAVDIREALHHLGEITGNVTTDDLLGNIFSNFCIGK